jgi:hypothetical protein
MGGRPCESRRASSGRQPTQNVRFEAPNQQWQLTLVQRQRITDGVFAGSPSWGYSVSAHITAEHEGAGSIPAKRISNSNERECGSQEVRTRALSSTGVGHTGRRLHACLIAYACPHIPNGRYSGIRTIRLGRTGRGGFIRPGSFPPPAWAMTRPATWSRRRIPTGTPRATHTTPSPGSCRRCRASWGRRRKRGRVCCNLPSS